MKMEVEGRILNLVEIMLKKCEDKSVDFIVDLIKTYTDESAYYVYELRIDGGSDSNSDFLSQKIEYNMLFNFGDKNPMSYIMINYSDRWDKNVKVFDSVKINKLKNRVIELYKESIIVEFDNILSKTIDIFDIKDAEIRDIKIKNLLEDE